MDYICVSFSLQTVRSGSHEKVVPLSGCSSPTRKMTCSEFNDLSLTERSSKLSSLLEEHNLRATDPDNIMGVTSAVESFCSSSSHDDSPLDDAADWDSKYW